MPHLISRKDNLMFKSIFAVIALVITASSATAQNLGSLDQLAGHFTNGEVTQEVANLYVDRAAVFLATGTEFGQWGEVNRIANDSGVNRPSYGWTFEGDAAFWADAADELAVNTRRAAVRFVSPMIIDQFVAQTVALCAMNSNLTYDMISTAVAHATEVLNNEARNGIEATQTRTLELFVNSLGM